VKPVRPQVVFEPHRLKMPVRAASIFLGITEEEFRRQVESGRFPALQLIRIPEGESVEFDVTLRFDF